MRIVAIDPSRTVLKIVSTLLEAQGHDVFAFVEPEQALLHIKRDGSVAAVLASGELGHMSGLEFCRQARLLSSARRPIYIILMSSNFDRQRLITALDSGADDFISKPPQPEELYARLRAADRVIAMQRELLQLATTDSLTGVLNRRAFFEEAHQECNLARAGLRLSAIMLDIDHFKRINDQYGHCVGDQVLRAVSKAATIEDAILGRLGGEEFALILAEHTAEEAAQKAEAIRQRCYGIRSEAGSDVPPVTCSFGVSEWVDGDTIDLLLKRADEALYSAKSSGRDRVVVATEASAPPAPRYSSVIRVRV